MDVARFKYPPHWVPLSRLWAATRALDPLTGLSRGYCLLSAALRHAPAACRSGQGEGGRESGGKVAEISNRDFDQTERGKYRRKVLSHGFLVAAPALGRGNRRV